MNVGERLGRLLFIVPYVADRGGVPLRELAAKTGVTPAQIRSDIALLMMVGQPPLTPDHLIDLYIEDDIVYVDLDQSLSRPLRLTHEEARALILGAKLAGDVGGLGQQLQAVIDEILNLLNPVDRGIVASLSKRIGLWQDGAEPSVPVWQLREAIDARREVEIDYYSVSSDRQKTYHLRPLILLSHSGAEYLVALDLGAEQREKLFRLDRMAAVTGLDTTFQPPENLDLERFRTQRLFFGAQSGGCVVRFGSKVAREVCERFADSKIEKEPDGAVRVTLASSSVGWLARWVLPFGADAEVLSPQPERAFVAGLVERAAAAYSRDP